jgi:hypothetical protein
MEDFLSAVEDVLGQVTKPVRADRWGAFWATQSIEGQVRAVGLCSYKKEPNDLGEVEIAYYTFPHREGCGIATAMVRELTDRASPHVAFAIAHTLPVENASCNSTLFTVYQTDQALVVRLGAPRFRGAFVLPGRDEQRPITRAARPGGVAESFFQHATPIMLLDSRQVFDQ